MSFPNNDAICQYDNSHTHTHSATSVQSWFDGHEESLQRLPWPGQLPDLTIIKLPWSVLERTLRSKFTPTSTFKQLEDVLLEDGYNITLETIHYLYESIPSRI